MTPDPFPAVVVTDLSLETSTPDQSSVRRGLSSRQNQSLVTTGSKGATIMKSSTGIITGSSSAGIGSRNRSPHPSSSSSARSLNPDPNPRINSRNGASNSLTPEIRHNSSISGSSNRRIGEERTVSYNKLKYVSDGNRSWLYLTPKSKADFGTVECWATNGIGKQRNACSFTVYPAGESVPLIVLMRDNETLFTSCRPDDGLISYSL